MQRTAILLAFVLLACGEDPERSYSTYDEAVADGAMKRGWLPAWLPPSATNIREWHDLDTNASFASFTYGAAAPETFLASCAKRERATVPPQTRLPQSEEVRSKLQFYRCVDGGVEVSWVAIEEARRVAYFWRS